MIVDVGPVSSFHHMVWHAQLLQGCSRASQRYACRAGSHCAPGFFEINAKFLLAVSMLTREDLPTFERPTTANSGLDGGGQPFNVTALPTYFAEFTRVNNDAERALLPEIFEGLRLLGPRGKAASPFSEVGLRKSSAASKSSSPFCRASNRRKTSVFPGLRVARGCRCRVLASLAACLTGKAPVCLPPTGVGALRKSFMGVRRARISR
jgi:hypothetical protein